MICTSTQICHNNICQNPNLQLHRQLPWQSLPRLGNSLLPQSFLEIFYLSTNIIVIVIIIIIVRIIIIIVNAITTSSWWSSKLFSPMTASAAASTALKADSSRTTTYLKWKDNHDNRNYDNADNIDAKGRMGIWTHSLSISYFDIIRSGDGNRAEQRKN